MEIPVSSQWKSTPRRTIGPGLDGQSSSPPIDRSAPEHILNTHAYLRLEVTDSPTSPSVGPQCQTRVGDTRVRQCCPPDGKIYPQLTKKRWKINLVQSLKRDIGWGTWIRTRTNGVRVRGSTVNLFPNMGGPGKTGPARRLITNKLPGCKPGSCSFCKLFEQSDRNAAFAGSGLGLPVAQKGFCVLFAALLIFVQRQTVKREAGLVFAAHDRTDRERPSGRRKARRGCITGR